MGSFSVPVTQKDLSGTIATSGNTVAIPVPEGTKSVEVFNPSAAALWVRLNGVPAVNGAGSVQLVAGTGYYKPPEGFFGTLQILSTAVTQPYSVYLC